MMMAYDSSQTPSSRLDDATVDAVRLALRAYLADSANPGELQAALHLMAAEARSRTILPEQLLVVLKDVWSTLPEVRSMTDSREQIRLLQRVVTMSIKEYFSA
jgi:ActR/RegA family two-component response regulator